MAEEHKPIDVPVLRRAAMDFLARREHSRLELQDKLRRRFPDAEDEMLDQLLAALAEEGLQSDARFTESWVRYRKSRGFAYRHIRADLESRGIASHIIEAHLFPDDEDWLAMAELLIERKLDRQTLEFGSREHRRLLRFLESRGFGQREIRQVIDRRLR